MEHLHQDYIDYRLIKSREAFRDARLLAQNQSWNASINRLYYACYYCVSALLLKHNIEAQTHAGCRTQFSLHFVKTGLVSIEQGKLYVDLMDWRQKGDYGDMYDFSQESVEYLFGPVEEFLNIIRGLIQIEPKANDK